MALTLPRLSRRAPNANLSWQGAVVLLLTASGGQPSLAGWFLLFFFLSPNKADAASTRCYSSLLIKSDNTLVTVMLTINHTGGPWNRGSDEKTSDECPLPSVPWLVILFVALFVCSLVSSFLTRWVKMPYKNTFAGHLSSNSDGSAVHVCIHEQHTSAHSAGTFHFWRIPCSVLKWQQRTYIFFRWSWRRLWTKATSTAASCKDLDLFSARICSENQWKTEHFVFFALTCLQDAWWSVDL